MAGPGLHERFALTVGVIDFLSQTVFYMTRRNDIAAGWIVTISFALAAAVGTLRGVFEFLIEHYFAFIMQRCGLIHTVTVLIINIVGAVIAAAIGYFYLYGENSLPGRRRLQAIAHDKKEQRGQRSTSILAHAKNNNRGR